MPLKGAHSSLWNQGLIVPSELDSTIVFSDSIVLTSNGAGVLAARWKTNDLYDCDPVLGSAAIAGFVEIMAFYNFYRVTSYTYEIDVINMEAHPVDVYILNQNTDPGTVGTNFIYIRENYVKNQSILLSPKGSGGDRKRFRRTLSISEVVGSRAPEFEDNYRGGTSSSPTDVTWLGVGLKDNYGLTASNGCNVKIRLMMHSRFYDRKTTLVALENARFEKWIRKLILAGKTSTEICLLVSAGSENVPYRPDFPKIEHAHLVKMIADVSASMTMSKDI